MPLLYHWTRANYRADLVDGVAWHLNQGSERLRQIDIGDSVWAFTRDAAGAYVLAAELVVRARTVNPPGYRYGPHRVWADVARSRYFRVEGQPAMEPLLRELSVRPKAKVLGQSFQGRAAVQVLDSADHAILAEASRDLALEPRAIAPDEAQLELALVAHTPTHLHALLPRGGSVASERWERVVRGFQRSAALVRDLRERYAGRCQLCEWRPRALYGVELCEGHHWHWLSRGGEDDLQNLVLLCPNHHRAVHGCDALLDFADGTPAFDFGEGRREPLRLDHHLTRAA